MTPNLTDTAFTEKCISETLAGLKEGISRFSGPSRCAVLFCLSPEAPLQIYDPECLLRGHEPRLQALFIDDQRWREGQPPPTGSFFGNLETSDHVQLDGLIHYAGRSQTVWFQLWLTEHHPDICSTGPSKCWLAHAALRFSHDIANSSELYTGISGNFLREYALQAVSDCIKERALASLGLNSCIDIRFVLEAVLQICNTPEEGAEPYGGLVFVEPPFLKHIDFISRFRPAQQPRLNHVKYVRKLLLAVEHSENKLISDGKSILGIAHQDIASFCFAADFQGKRGFLHLNNEPVCSFEDGSYHSTTYRAKLFEIEEILLDFSLDSSTRNQLFQIVSILVHNAQSKKFGCSVVLDLGTKHVPVSGQKLDPPIDLRQDNLLQLACGLAKVDGALYIRNDLKLYGFACLLDGLSINEEDRSRGARYNSALRFTAERREALVVVVSSDRPVSIIYQGEEVRKGFSCPEAKGASKRLLSLNEWLQN